MLVRLKMFSHSEITKFALLDYSAKVLKNKQKTKVFQTISVLCDGVDYDKQSFFGHAYFQAPDIDGKVYFTKAQTEQILEAVLYHHADALVNAPINNDSLAYIICMANSIALTTDRCKEELEDYKDLNINLNTIFFGKTDYVKYKITIKNNTKGIMKIDEVIDNLDSDVIDTEYEYEKKELKKDENNAVRINTPIADIRNLSGCVNERLVNSKRTLKIFEKLMEKSFSKLISSIPISAKISAVSSSIASAML